MKIIKHNNIYDSMLETRETMALHKFEHVLKTLQGAKLNRWFKLFLSKRIMPSFLKVGFNESLTSLLFKMAAPSWEAMGPLSDEKYRLFPNIDKELKKIRKGILLQEEKKKLYQERIQHLNSQQLYQLFNNKMNDTSVQNVLDEIVTSWIILPRAYGLLEKKQAKFLPCYLKHINSEKNPLFLKILLKIIIEFSANFSLRHIHKTEYHHKMCEALFYGYSAMFWQNLRQPADGYEELLIFDIFYQWTAKLIKQEALADMDILNTLADMKKFRDLFFLLVNTHGFSNSCIKDSCWLLVLFRHGETGIDAALNHFCTSKLLIRNTTQGGLSYIEVPKSLWIFLKNMKNSLPYEKPKTRESFFKFISRLKTGYQIDFQQSDKSGPVKFTGPRVLQMVNEFS